MAETVTVACKLPAGLCLGIDYGNIILKGANQPGAQFGFGITHGVDKELFEKWVEAAAGPQVPERQRFPALVKKHIFAFPKADMVLDAAREMTAERTGFEGLNPDAPDPQVEPTESQKKENAKRSRKV